MELITAEGETNNDLKRYFSKQTWKVQNGLYLVNCWNAVDGVGLFILRKDVRSVLKFIGGPIVNYFTTMDPELGTAEWIGSRLPGNRVIFSREAELVLKRFKVRQDRQPLALSRFTHFWNPDSYHDKLLGKE